MKLVFVSMVRKAPCVLESVVGQATILSEPLPRAGCASDPFDLSQSRSTTAKDCCAFLFLNFVRMRSLGRCSAPHGLRHSRS